MMQHGRGRELEAAYLAGIAIRTRAASRRGATIGGMIHSRNAKAVLSDI
jgi:hypothetical protein